MVKVADYAGGSYVVKENVIVGLKESEENSNEGIDNEVGKTTENSEKNEAENEVEETKKTESSSNPTTSDNIIKIMEIFVIATIGLFVSIKLLKNRKNK